MQFIDLKSQYERIQDDVNKKVLNVLASQRYVMGPEIAEVENRLAEFAGVKHAITCSSGTDALVIPLMSYDLKVTDAVFVPAFTFFASAESISLAGGTPVFVDIDPDTFNIDPNSLVQAIEKAAGGGLRPRGIVAVDLFGQPADYEAINKIANDHDLFVIEDAAQGFGSSQNGKKAGSLAKVAATSFFPAKPLGCYGDGGAIFTDDDEVAELLTSIRVHGQGNGDKYDNVRLGINGRFDTIQAAIILSKLDIFEDEIISRNEVASTYSSLLHDHIKTPVVKDGNMSVWAQYTLTAKDEAERSKIMDACKKAEIPTAIYYPIPIHLSTAYKELGYKPGDLTVTEDLSKRVFSLPIHPYLSRDDIERISNIVIGAIQ